MSPSPGAPWLLWEPEARRLTIAGEWRGEAIGALTRGLAALELPDAGVELALGELELEDGVAVAELVTALRALAARAGPLRLCETPQMLAHTLYKVGELDHGAIAVVTTREDEPTTAN